MRKPSTSAQAALPDMQDILGILEEGIHMVEGGSLCAGLAAGGLQL